jgi:hypothetical protein
MIENKDAADRGRRFTPCRVKNALKFGSTLRHPELINMTPCKILLTAAFAGALLLSVPAHAADDPSHFQLTPALMQKLSAAEADMKQLPAADAQPPEVDPAQSVDAAIRKMERDSATVAVLAKHGLTARDLVLAAHALLHAGTFVSIEKTTEPKAASDMLDSYTKEQRANIALVREMTRPKN